MKYPRLQRGFTLIEIIIGAGLGLIMVLMMFSLLQQQIRTTRSIQDERSLRKDKNSFFHRFEQSFQRATIGIESLAVHLGEYGDGQSIRFEIRAGENSQNCLGRYMASHTDYTDTYYIKNNQLYCVSRYKKVGVAHYTNDRQPLVSGVEAWKIQPYLLKQHQTEFQSCLQGMDLQLIFNGKVFQHRFIAPGCIEWSS